MTDGFHDAGISEGVPVPIERRRKPSGARMAKRGFLRVSEGQDANPVRHKICAPATRQSEQPRELRADGHGVIVPTMAGQTKRAIRDQDVQGLKCLRKIRPLLSRLRKVGTERDRAGNRRPFMDHSCALILMALFSPMIRSLRDPQRACALEGPQATWREPRIAGISISVGGDLRPCPAQGDRGGTLVDAQCQGKASFRPTGCTRTSRS
jgi:hypothetical protein